MKRKHDIEHYLGQFVEVVVRPGMTCTCLVLDVDRRNRFGHGRVLVQPLEGSGKAWVAKWNYMRPKKRTRTKR